MRIACVVTTASLVALGADAGAQRGGGEVRMPLSEWNALAAALAARPPPRPPPVAATVLARTIDGRFDRGLLRAELVARVEVLADSGRQLLPVVDSACAIERALLDGKPAALVVERGMYSASVDRPGRHEVRLKLLAGQSQDSDPREDGAAGRPNRFARQLRLRLPPGGATSFSILIPEQGIDARIEGGVLAPGTPHGEGTLLGGELDGKGVLDLSWTRRVTHRGPAPPRIDARVTTLLTVEEAAIHGVAVFDISIVDGETDRIDFLLPADVEPLRVSGEAVLQWQATAKRRQLSALLRYLARGRTRVVVHFLAPGKTGGRLSTPLILPAGGARVSGTVGVAAPASLEVQVGARAARRLDPRELPAELRALSRTPLLAGFEFSAEPGLELALARRRRVALTSTLIDELHAATVAAERGMEVTKLRLHIRNNTRQYLALTLPAGAQLDHALLDGQPIRAARAGAQLLFPLRQSERRDDGTRLHLVEPGQTLGDIAHFYYSDPDKWPLVLEANRHQLRDERSLRAGQRLRIPRSAKQSIEESSFVLELAYRRTASPLGALGRRRYLLPELDVDVMSLYWHLYLPGSITPLRFDGNLTQHSGLRYDPLRRARDFLRRALGERQAWAGDYRSILRQRKSIFRSDAARRGGNEAAPSAFPLVGERYRFRRILGAREQATIAVLYVERSLATVARAGALLLAAGLALLVLLRPGRWSALCAFVGGALLLVLAHHLGGVHHRIVGGALGAFPIAWWLHARGAGARGRWRELLAAPWTALRLATPRSVLAVLAATALALFVLRYPLLLSTAMLAALSVAWVRAARRRARAAAVAATEVSDEALVG